jgi:hypothetical protein
MTLCPATYASPRSLLVSSSGLSICLPSQVGSITTGFLRNIFSRACCAGPSGGWNVLAQPNPSFWMKVRRGLRMVSDAWRHFKLSDISVALARHSAGETPSSMPIVAPCNRNRLQSKECSSNDWTEAGWYAVTAIACGRPNQDPEWCTSIARFSHDLGISAAPSTWDPISRRPFEFCQDLPPYPSYPPVQLHRSCYKIPWNIGRSLQLRLYQQSRNPWVPTRN